MTKEIKVTKKMQKILDQYAEASVLICRIYILANSKDPLKHSKK